MFLFFLFPVVFSYCVYHDFKTCGAFYLKHRILVILFAVICGCAAAALFEFVIFVPEYFGTNFLLYVLVHWIFGFVIPLLFYVLFVLWSKDSWKDRIDSFLYFMLPFFSVYVPFVCFSQEKYTSFFFLFIAPLLMMFTIFAIKREVIRIFTDIQTKTRSFIPSVFLILFESILPFVIQGLWYFDFSFFVWIPLFSAYVVFCVVHAKLDFKSVIELIKL